MKNNFISIFILSATSLAFTPSFAEDFHPRLSGEILFEVQNDLAHDSDDRDAEVNTLFTTIESALTLSLSDRLALEAALVFEPVQDTDPGDDTVFENEGLYAEELKITYMDKYFTLFAGKYNPAFGTAWDLAPGIYGVDFAEDYELAERIGFGGSYIFDTARTGRHTVTGNVFFADTTVLSDSIITKRGNTDKSDGGISNTEDLSSFSLTLDSENIAGIEGLNTHIGYENQSEGDADTGFDNETGYVVGAHYTRPVTNDIEVAFLAEWAGIRNAGGGNDDIDYLTTSLGLTIRDSWNVAFSYTHRDTDVNGGTDSNDHLYQISAGYTFDNGFSIDAGYRGSEESNSYTHILGVLAAYTYTF